MDACGGDLNRNRPIPEDIASELDAWFSVSGDMDDFIYYGDCCKKHSEK